MPKKSDLKARTLSAIVMVAVAASALWLGGRVWALFVLIVGAGVLWEWVKLARAIATSPVGRAAWYLVGLGYIGLACEVLLRLRLDGISEVAGVVAMVIATDVGAYFAGRTLGGPKIAPKISPSKTWSGLAGGIIGAGLVPLVYVLQVYTTLHMELATPWTMGDWFAVAAKCAGAGAIVAIVAQSGDFFESWMKRRAGVKDSGNLIPGHGGLFDRVDGLLAVCFATGVLMLVSARFQGL